MYHSHLLINVGDNPDRPDWNICRRWLRNLYRVHQRLCMAFPSSKPPQHERETAYCRPFSSSGFPALCELPVQIPDDDRPQMRAAKSGFLFRIDYPVDSIQGGRRPVIIVQSEGPEPPDWDYAFGLDKGAVDDRGRPIGNADFLLAGPPQLKEVFINLDGDSLVLNCDNRPRHNHRLRPGDLVRFRLMANPTRKTQDGSSNGKRKRVEPTLKAHADWLSRKLREAAGSPICIETFVPGWAHGWRTKYEPQPGQRMQWWSVLFEGIFRLQDPSVLKQLLECGVGSAKAFGFGLLSVAPVQR
ncbi:MAG: type I-E CRISPR-associated protein Cas6/Cse3/CasE [Desulfomonile tiedjei]|uniref:Type I-E CRISPR-associated protein Cas6/Cse3/CasE n=1 Tax=Desulfomonile tiedjei TaxID=2358 RepID=A0A9D6UY62_9BACT|nr:type I-E CRISPR-associated protein Cas6/Cse3/CasE [Desulfomonile tiedjei]